MKKTTHPISIVTTGALGWPETREKGAPIRPSPGAPSKIPCPVGILRRLWQRELPFPFQKKLHVCRWKSKSLPRQGPIGDVWACNAARAIYLRKNQTHQSNKQLMDQSVNPSNNWPINQSIDLEGKLKPHRQSSNQALSYMYKCQEKICKQIASFLPHKSGSSAQQ